MVIKKIWGLLYSELIKAILSKYPWLKHLLWQCSGSCVGRTTKLPFNVAMSKRPLTTTVPLQSCAKAGAKAVAWGESTQVKACMAIQGFLLLYLNTLLKSRASEEWVLTTFRLVQTVPKLNTFLYCQFGPFFEIHNGPNLIWERFVPTEKLSGLILH